MSTPNHTTSPAGDPLAPQRIEVLTGPSMVVRLTIRPMSKVLNPLVKKMAGRKYVGWAAQVNHRGRRSGRAYTTTAGARVRDEVIWIPLTFGTRSDWCRNVRAAGECGIRWKGTDYTGADPVVLDRRVAMSAAKKAFKLPERGAMHAMGIKHFVRLEVRP
jgi:deazaflavin-dependent oxidoreductase (nitroreductase family)